MPLQKKDFIEIDFTGRIKDGEIFDSTIKENLEKLHQGHNHEIEAKPFIFCLGERMFLKAIDDFLIDKEIGKNYEIELKPEEAFGKRNPDFIQTIPMGVFHEKNINPVAGVAFNFDGKVGKVLAVSGGRVIIDFNHFLAGKTLAYNINVLRRVDDLNEKVQALNEFFFRKDFKHEVKEGKLLLDVETPLVKVVELFKEKFKEILGLELEIRPVGENTEQVEKSQ